MPTKLDLIQEAARRGILPESKKQLYEEAVKRGLIGGVVGDKPSGEGSGVSGTWEEPTLVGSLAKGAKAFPSSAAKYGKQIFEAVTNPIDTMNAMAGFGTGMLHKAIPGEQVSPFSGVSYEQLADKALGEMAAPYQSYNAFLDTLAQDPVRLLSDASAFAGGAGAVAKAGGQIGGMNRLANAGATIQRGAAAVEPVSAALNLAKLPLKVIPERLPVRMYRSAIKTPDNLYGQKLSRVDKDNIARTGLREGVGDNVKGIEKVGAKIDSLNDQVDAIIESGTTAGKTIDPEVVVAGLDDLITQYKYDVAPKSDLATLESLKREFMKFHGRKTKKVDTPNYLLSPKSKNVTEKRMIPIGEAQKIKRMAYKKLKKKYGQFDANQEEVAGRKAMARTIKDEIAKVFPEVSGLNAKEGEMIRLQNALEHAMNRKANRQMVSLGGKILGTASGMKGFLLNLLIDNPSVKTSLARALYKASKTKFTDKQLIQQVLRDFQEGEAE